MIDKNIGALYELKRQSFLLGFVQNPDRFSEALAFAYYHRMAPFFHETHIREVYHGVDPFEDIYAVKWSFVDEVTSYVDSCWRSECFEGLGFESLEDRFGGYRTNRVELIHVLGYARIDGRFDGNIWRAIEKNAPIEAKPIPSTFKPEDVHFG